MKRMLISLAAASLLFAALLSAPAFADGEDAAQLPHVTDSADILSASETETLETLAQQVSAAHSCGVYIVTLDNYRDYTNGGIADCSEAIYRYYQLGWGDGQDGVLLLLSMYDRDYDVCAYGDYANASFTDYGKDELAGMFLDNFRKDDWYGGFADYIRGCGELLQLSEDGQPLDAAGYGGQEQIPVGLKLALMILLPCAVAMVVCVVLVSRMKTAKVKTEAGDYAVPGSLNMLAVEDIFTHRTEHREIIQQNRSGGPGGGTSINSGGFSHSSGKF